MGESLPASILSSGLYFDLGSLSSCTIDGGGAQTYHMPGHEIFRWSLSILPLTHHCLHCFKGLVWKTAPRGTCEEMKKETHLGDWEGSNDYLGVSPTTEKPNAFNAVLSTHLLVSNSHTAILTQSWLFAGGLDI